MYYEHKILIMKVVRIFLLQVTMALEPVPGSPFLKHSRNARKAQLGFISPCFSYLLEKTVINCFFYPIRRVGMKSPLAVRCMESVASRRHGITLWRVSSFGLVPYRRQAADSIQAFALIEGVRCFKTCKSEPVVVYLTLRGKTRGAVTDLAQEI